MHQITDDFKIDLALVGQTISNSNVTGRYFKMAGYRRAVAILLGGAEAATKTSKLEIYQATDEAGTSAKAISSAAATATSGTKDIAATIALGSAAATDTVTINGVTFTMAGENDTDAGEFADDDGLVLCIAASTIANQVKETAANDTVTLVANDGYTITLAKGENSGTITLATTQSAVIVEVDEDDLDYSNGFDCIAPKVTCTGNGIDAVAIVRMAKDRPVSQAVSASKVMA